MHTYRLTNEFKHKYDILSKVHVLAKVGLEPTQVQRLSCRMRVNQTAAEGYAIYAHNVHSLRRMIYKCTPPCSR